MKSRSRCEKASNRLHWNLQQPKQTQRSRVSRTDFAMSSYTIINFVHRIQMEKLIRIHYLPWSETFEIENDSKVVLMTMKVDELTDDIALIILPRAKKNARDEWNELTLSQVKVVIRYISWRRLVSRSIFPRHVTRRAHLSGHPLRLVR